MADFVPNVVVIPNLEDSFFPNAIEVENLSRNEVSIQEEEKEDEEIQTKHRDKVQKDRQRKYIGEGDTLKNVDVHNVFNIYVMISCRLSQTY